MVPGGKRGGGIVGITRATAALCRWTLTYTLRAHIAALTRKMFHVANDDKSYATSPTRQGDCKMIPMRRKLSLFPIKGMYSTSTICNQATIPERLRNIVTKDVATTRIEESLLIAKSLARRS